MPDLLPSTEHPLRPGRFQTSIKLHSGIPPAAEQSVQICSAFLRCFNYFESHGSKWSSDKAPGISPHSNRHESILPAYASRSRRVVVCKEGAEPMTVRQKTRDIARNLVACESDASTTPRQTPPAT